MPSHHDPHHAADHGAGRSSSRGLHKDWRAWAVVLVMLAGMAAYVLSFDEEDQPGGATAPAVPAATE